MSAISAKLALAAFIAVLMCELITPSRQAPPAQAQVPAAAAEMRH